MAKIAVIPKTARTQNKKVRVAAYCRVSTDHNDLVNSYDAQVRYFSGLYSNSKTEVLVDIYADEGISGTSVEKRTEFGRLMEDCRAGKIDRVITKSISRFARNTKDCLQYIRELKGLGITVYFEKENIDTARLSDEMMITVMGGLAQEESQSISNNVRWTFQRAMASGTLRHARIPYGYLKDDKTGNLVIDPEKAMIVRRIFDMYIGGMGIKRIAVQLNEEGIPSPTGIQWNNITINKMLRQEKYIGDTLWQKTYSEFMGKKYQTNYGQQTKYYLRDTHPAIISREDFAKVAEIKKKQAAPKGELIVSPFRKKLICGKCGHSYSSSNYLNNLSWHCGFRNNVPAPCDNITVRDRTLHFAFRAMCDKLHTHGAKIFGTCIHELKRLHKAQDNNTDEATQVRKEIAELKDKKHRLSKLLTKHFIEPEQYSAQVYEIDAQIRMLNRKLEKSPEKKDPITLRLEELAEIFENYDGSEKAQAVVMETAVQKIMVCEDGTIHFQLLDGLEFVERIETYEGH